MKQIITEISIQAPPQVIGNVLTEFEKYPAWNPFIKAITGSAVEGDKLKVVIKPENSKEMTFPPRIINVKESKELRWIGRLLLPGLLDGEHIFRIETIDNSQCSFVQREIFRGILVSLFWKGLNTNTRNGFKLMNRALKEQAEKKVK